MGLHMADEVTGEFSLGASGYLYENGRFVHPVRGVTIAGNLKDLLASISLVGDDLTWYGSVGCPTFLLPQLSVSGN
jgi:PmbA protein